jgi:hypothetical protein
MAAHAGDTPRTGIEARDIVHCFHEALDSLMAASDRLDPASREFRQTVRLMRKIADAIDELGLS